MALNFSLARDHWSLILQIQWSWKWEKMQVIIKTPTVTVMDMEFWSCLCYRFFFPNFFVISGYLSLTLWHCALVLPFEKTAACYTSNEVKTCIALREIIKLSVTTDFLHVLLSNMISPKDVGRLFLCVSSMIKCFI